MCPPPFTAASVHPVPLFHACPSPLPAPARLSWLAHTLGHEMLHALLFTMCSDTAAQAPKNMSYQVRGGAGAGAGGCVLYSSVHIHTHTHTHTHAHTHVFVLLLHRIHCLCAAFPLCSLTHVFPLIMSL